MLVPENQSPTVAVLLPCYNEEVTIGKVVRDFKASLPQADIYVYDNNSTDRTADIAASEGAIVRKNHVKARAMSFEPCSKISMLTCTSCLTATIRTRLTPHPPW